MPKTLTVRMLDLVHDTNDHLICDEAGNPVMREGSPVIEHRTDKLEAGSTHTLPDWQAAALLEKGFAEVV